MTIQTFDNKFGVAKWIVDPVVGQGTHTTIASALTSATSGDTIFIRPGTYTENLTLKAGVNLTAFLSDGMNPNVTIVGKCSANFAGTCSISSVQLKTSSDYLLAVTGSSATIVNLINCTLNILNNNGISYTSSSSSSYISLNSCYIILNASYTTFISSGAGYLQFLYCKSNTSVISSVASTLSTGSLYIQHSLFCHPITLTSFSDSSINYAEILTSNNTCLTTVTSGNLDLQNVYLQSGNQPCISVGASTTVYCNECTLNTSNTNGVTGAGTAVMTPIAWENAGTVVNATTMTDAPFGFTYTYSPVIAFGGASVGVTYLAQTGKYWVFGKVVFVNAIINLSSKGSSVGTMTLSLPCASAGDGCRHAFAAQSNTSFPGGTGSLVTAIDSGTSVISFLAQNSGSVSALTNSNFANNSYVLFSGFYWVD